MTIVACHKHFEVMSPVALLKLLLINKFSQHVRVITPRCQEGNLLYVLTAVKYSWQIKLSLPHSGRVYSTYCRRITQTCQASQYKYVNKSSVPSLSVVLLTFFFSCALISLAVKQTRICA